MSITRKFILENAITLFSQQGFNGVSIRNIADASMISAPALYNHFKDKQTLYITAIAESFQNKSAHLLDALNGQGKAIERLEGFITCLSEELYNDPNFRRLMQRELLDGDEKRLQFLAQEVFRASFTKLMTLLKELKPAGEAHSLAIIIIGMVQKPFEISPLTKFFPEYQEEQINPTFVTQQVMSILSTFLGEQK